MHFDLAKINRFASTNFYLIFLGIRHKYGLPHICTPSIYFYNSILPWLQIRNNDDTTYLAKETTGFEGARKNNFFWLIGVNNCDPRKQHSIERFLRNTINQ